MFPLGSTSTTPSLPPVEPGPLLPKTSMMGVAFTIVSGVGLEYVFNRKDSQGKPSVKPDERPFWEGVFVGTIATSSYLLHLLGKAPSSSVATFVRKIPVLGLLAIGSAALLHGAGYLLGVEELKIGQVANNLGSILFAGGLLYTLPHHAPKLLTALKGSGTLALVGEGLVVASSLYFLNTILGSTRTFATRRMDKYISGIDIDSPDYKLNEQVKKREFYQNAGNSWFGPTYGLYMSLLAGEIADSVLWIRTQCSRQLKSHRLRNQQSIRDQMIRNADQLSAQMTQIVIAQSKLKEDGTGGINPQEIKSAIREYYQRNSAAISQVYQDLEYIGHLTPNAYRVKNILRLDGSFLEEDSIVIQDLIQIAQNEMENQEKQRILEDQLRGVYK